MRFVKRRDRHQTADGTRRRVSACERQIVLVVEWKQSLPRKGVVERKQRLLANKGSDDSSIVACSWKEVLNSCELLINRDLKSQDTVIETTSMETKLDCVNEFCHIPYRNHRAIELLCC
mgnify:CR=1 FL=1